MALMHLYCGKHKPLQHSGNNLKNELERDKAMKTDISKTTSYQTCIRYIPWPVQIRQEKHPLLHTRASALSITVRLTWLPSYPLWMPSVLISCQITRKVSDDVDFYLWTSGFRTGATWCTLTYIIYIYCMATSHIYCTSYYKQCKLFSCDLFLARTTPRFCPSAFAQ
jgi:hypothetical protein